MKRVLVTGTSSGIGKAAVEYLLEKGYFVYANVLDESLADVWKGRENVRALSFDVRKDDEIGRAVHCIREDGGDLYAIVNNAGISNWGPILDIPDRVFLDTLETNLLGTFRVTRAFFPLLSAGEARIVNITSVAGKLFLPFMGPYPISKAGIEAFSDMLRRELRVNGNRNVRVVVIEPGTIDTPIWDRARATTVFPTSSPFYETAYAMGHALIRRELAVAFPPEAIARTIYAALSAPHPKTRYLVGPGSLTIRLLLALPDSWADWILYRIGRRLLRKP